MRLRSLSETMTGIIGGKTRHDRLDSEEDLYDSRGKNNQKRMKLAELTIHVSKKPFRMSSGFSIFKKTETYIRIQSSYTRKPDLKSVVLKKISDVEVLSQAISAGKSADLESKVEEFFADDLKGLSLQEQGYQVEAYLEHLSDLKSMDSRLILLEWLKLDEYKEPPRKSSPATYSPGSKENVRTRRGSGTNSYVYPEYKRGEYSTGSDISVGDIDFSTAC